MRLGSGEVVSATAVGEARLEFRNNYLVLNNVYFIPGFRRNLISISVLHEQMFNISFYDNKIIISRNGFEICQAKPENGLYLLRPDKRQLNNSELFKCCLSGLSRYNPFSSFAWQISNPFLKIIIILL